MTEEELIQQFKNYRNERNKHRWTSLLSAIGGRPMPQPGAFRMQQAQMQMQQTAASMGADQAPLPATALTGGV